MLRTNENRKNAWEQDLWYWGNCFQTNKINKNLKKECMRSKTSGTEVNCFQTKKIIKNLKKECMKKARPLVKSKTSGTEVIYF